MRQYLQVLTIHQPTANTPLIVLIYLPASKTKNLTSGVRWVQKLMDGSTQATGLMSIFATFMEQKLLVQLLDQNSKLLDPQFKATVRKQHMDVESEKDFAVSFIMPVATLSSEALGKLNADTGCAICGNNMSKRCSQCQSVQYCGAGQFRTSFRWCYVSETELVLPLRMSSAFFVCPASKYSTNDSVWIGQTTKQCVVP